MRTPLSPSQLLESGRVLTFGVVCQELSDTPTSVAAGLNAHQNLPPGQGGAYSLCEECNLQLTSAAQAQLHYNGRSHLRRVRQLRGGETGRQAAAGTQSSSQPAGQTPAPGLSLGLQPPPSNAAGSGCGPLGGVLPGHVAGGGSSIMIKPFLSFPVEMTSPVSLFPNFNMMDPVQKAVIKHTFGASMVIKRKQVISCDVCQLRFNSDSQADAHYRGSRHAKRLKSQENKVKLSVTSGTNGCSATPAGPAHPASDHSSTNQRSELFSSPDSSSSPLRAFLLSCSPSSLSSSSPSSSTTGSEPPPSSPPSALPTRGLTSSSSSSSKASPPPPPAPSNDAPVQSEEEQKARKLLYCSLCKVAVNSLSQLEAHNTGSKHKTMLEARIGSGPIKSFPRPGAKLKNVAVSGGSKGSGLQDKTFHCQICDVHVNSEIQLKQHISSRRHKDKVAGKPSKPKYSPYSKQRSTLPKELVKPPLSTPFPSSPLTSSLSLPPASLSSSPLSLHPSPVSSSLFAASFLRPAPGPIRTSQGSILFTPY